MLFNAYKKQKGFTIIELIISIFILSIAVVGVFGAFSMIVILTSDATNRLTATYLAQEGMEIIRNIRDSNWLNMDANPGMASWDDYISSCEGSGCEVDFTTTGSVSNPIRPYTLSGNYLNKNVNGFYSYGSGTATKFKRKITVSPIQDVDGKSDHILMVITRVAWDQKATVLGPSRLAETSINADCAGSNSSNCITIEETLYNWYNYTNP